MLQFAEQVDLLRPVCVLETAMQSTHRCQIPFVALGIGIEYRPSFKALRATTLELAIAATTPAMTLKPGLAPNLNAMIEPMPPRWSPATKPR